MLRRRRHFIKRAVHAVTDTELGFKRLEVNVARTVGHGLLQDEIDEFDNRHLVGQFLGGARVFAGLVHFAGDVLVRAKLLQDFRKTFIFLLPVKPFDGLLNFRRVGDDHLHVAFDGKLDFVGARRIQRIGQRNLQRGTVQRNWHATIHPRNISRNRF